MATPRTNAGRATSHTQAVSGPRPPKSPRVYLRVRSHAGAEGWRGVWLCRKDGAAHGALLWGELSAPAVEELITWAENLGIPVEHEQSPLTAQPLGRVGPTLFDAVEET
jgi:hypothetical protein